MASIGVNAVRTYHVRPALDHSACMAVFANLGIYLFVDLDDYVSQLDENTPGWTNQQKAYFEAVMDEFSQYDNVAGFFIGNENINSGKFSNMDRMTSPPRLTPHPRRQVWCRSLHSRRRA